MQADKATVGLLGRLHTHTISITHIGKESNLLEQQEEGVLDADPQAAILGRRGLRIAPFAAQAGADRQAGRSIGSE